MTYICLVCEAIFDDTDQNRSEQRNGLCPVCGHEDIEEKEPIHHIIGDYEEEICRRIPTP